MDFSIFWMRLIGYTSRVVTKSVTAFARIIRTSGLSGAYAVGCLLGYAGVDNEKALSFLKERVSCDENWRVQEMLAKSFDFICKERGYERTLPLIAEWLADGHPNVVRAVTEGLRIWTRGPIFKEHPLEAVAFLSRHKADSSEYVRKSVGNALRDISKKFPQLILDELDTWDQSDPNVRYTYRLAAKHLLEKEKRGKQMN